MWNSVTYKILPFGVLAPVNLNYDNHLTQSQWAFTTWHVNVWPLIMYSHISMSALHPITTIICLHCSSITDWFKSRHRSMHIHFISGHTFERHTVTNCQHKLFCLKKSQRRMAGAKTAICKKHLNVWDHRKWKIVSVTSSLFLSWVVIAFFCVWMFSLHQAQATSRAPKLVINQNV